MRDHRKFSRLPIEGSLTGDITVALPLEVTQISAGGVLVETDRPLRLESLHELRFALEGAALVDPLELGPYGLTAKATGVIERAMSMWLVRPERRRR